MKRINYLIVITLLICNLGWAQSLQIETTDIKVTVGDSIQLVVTFYDAATTPIDTTIDWSIDPTNLGQFKDNGLFVASEKGKGTVTASVGDIKDNAKIHVLSVEESQDEIEGWTPLSIVPKDTMLAIGETVQFKALFKTKEDIVVDTTGVWNVEGDSIGSITQDGFFTATQAGLGYISVQVDSLIAASIVIVVDSPMDTSSAHNIYISRVLPKGKVLPPRKIKEGQMFTLGGLPHPLNILNGGLIHFPAGCLTEDITIQIQLPEKAKDNGKQVVFEDEVLNGVSFNVFVNDSLISPYYFEKPLTVALPFKRGLVKQYNLTPEKLTMYYQEDTGLFNDVGISNVMVDSASNRIIAQVEHFSTLVLRKKQASTEINLDEGEQPQNYSLLSNYPNPFNPSTTIEYQVLSDGNVSLKVFDLLGKEIATLVDAYRTRGLYRLTWNAQDNTGNQVAGGVYFLQLQLDNLNVTKRIIYLR